MTMAAAQDLALLLVQLVGAGDLEALLLQVWREKKITVMYYSKNMNRSRHLFLCQSPSETEQKPNFEF
jgi:hypothetical protein